ncbi:hypothetical protein ACIQGZ_00305 [Streptomyces sp. NPDC092296]|uniref:hypothetical protein n=1 Tax=Streptomyces sp. NPDC092296 TaxID=3366012 RepID=UPI0038308C04
MSDPVPSGVAAAASRLRALLTSTYQRRWLAHSRRMRGDGLSYAAVSQVVALHLWESGLRTDTDRDLPRKLRDRIRQALRGEQLTQETIGWLVEAFDFTEDDARSVWDAFSGGNASDLEDDGISATLRQLAVPIVKPQRHRTTALFSRYHIGPDLMLRRIESSHVIVALEDGVDTFAYSPRDTVVDADVVSGGTLVGRHESTLGFIGLEFRLDRPLAEGRHASLQYYTTHRPTPEPCTQVRRAARKRIENVDLRVIFEGPVPARAWWCVWDAYSEGDAVQRRPARVSARSELHQFLPYAEEAVIGFEWEW